MPKKGRQFPETLALKASPELAEAVRRGAQQRGVTPSSWMRDALRVAAQNVSRDVLPARMSVNGAP